MALKAHILAWLAQALYRLAHFLDSGLHDKGDWRQPITYIEPGQDQPEYGEIAP